MTVHFIGAGPGAADLVTVRAARLIASAPVCLYAGALVPHLIGGEPQDEPARGLERTIHFLVLPSRRIRGVAAAVDLHYDPAFRPREIRFEG